MGKGLYLQLFYVIYQSYIACRNPIGLVVPVLLSDLVDLELGYILPYEFIPPVASC